MTLESDIAYLRTIPMFCDVPAARLKLVVMMAERLRYAAGDIIIREREHPDAAFLILDGEVEIARETANEHLHALSIMRGGMFGDVPMLCNSTYIGHATAKTDVDALRLPKDLFIEFLETVPEFAVALARDLASRLHRMAATVLHAKAAT